MERGKESACNTGDLGSIPGLGRSPGEGKGYPLQYSCLENPYQQRSLVYYTARVPKESVTTERRTLSVSFWRGETPFTVGRLWPWSGGQGFNPGCALPPASQNLAYSGETSPGLRAWCEGPQRGAASAASLCPALPGLGFRPAQTAENRPVMQEARVRPLGREVPAEKGMATHCRVLVWRIPRTEEPGGPQSAESQSRTPVSD